PATHHALANILSPPQEPPPHPSRSIAVREPPFQQFPTPPPQLLSPFPANPPPVGIHDLLCFQLVSPTTPSTIRFGGIRSHFRFRQRLKRVVAVISLVGDRFPRAFRLYPFAHFFVVGRTRNLGDLLARLRQGLQNRLRIARIAGGHRH